MLLLACAIPEEACDPTVFFLDGDADGWGDSAHIVRGCDLPIGAAAQAGDCDDVDPMVFPGAPEVCDEVDQDCDREVDEGVTVVGYADEDGDGYGDPSDARAVCALDGRVVDSTDCDDGDAAVNPSAVERCDGVDEDCDGAVDEGLPEGTWYVDADGDGHGDPATAVDGCATDDAVASGDDCDDSDATACPGLDEVCGDAVDNDCDTDFSDCALVGGWDEASAGTVLWGSAEGGWAGFDFELLDDLDGDGIPEVAVGAPGVADADGEVRGAVYLAPGRAGGTFELEAASYGRWEGGSTSGGIGYDLAALGDIYGDGGSWFLTADNEDDDETGVAWLLSAAGAGGTTADAEASLTGQARHENLGTVSAVGDVDGDGRDDFLVGSGYTRAEAYLFTHVPSGVDRAARDADATLTGGVDTWFGLKPSPRADTNGDGTDDLVIAAPLADSQAGVVYVFEGPVTDASPGEADASFGGEPGDTFGFSVASGDLDGDGHADLAAGAPYRGSNSGAVYAVLGPVFGRVDVRIEGEAGDDLGCGVSMGDLDGDGADELVAGALWRSGYAGAVYAWYGLAPGSWTSADATLSYSGTDYGDFVGFHTAVADANGDGVLDLLVGADQRLAPGEGGYLAILPTPGI